MAGSVYGKGTRGRATKLHSQVVRARGRCERCGSARSLQCAHIIPRRYAATRTDEANAFCLCAGDHLRFSEHADEWMQFVDDRIGRAEFDRLKAKALDPSFKPKEAFWQAEVDRLTTLLADASRLDSPG